MLHYYIVLSPEEACSAMLNLTSLPLLLRDKGDKTNVQNYRPISLTSLVMKVMERVIRDELYMKCLNRIGDKQYGFLPNRSYVTQMTYVIDDDSTTECRQRLNVD